MKTREQSAAALREREKELWSAIEDYKDGSCDHQRVQVYLDLYISAERLDEAIDQSAERARLLERIRKHKAALNVALAYASGDLMVATHEADEEVAGCQIVLEEG